MAIDTDSRRLQRLGVTSLALFALLVFVLAIIMQACASRPVLVGTDTSTGGGVGNESGSIAVASTTATPLVVQVVGQVQSPGLVTINAGSRVMDAITAAGGVTGTADLTRVNVARFAVDGEQIYVPAVGEQVSGAARGAAGGAGNGAAGSSNAPPVNLNTATAIELETLPKVGPALAAKIIAYREQVGRFASVEELDNVSGIGEAMMATLRDLVTI